MTSTPETAAAAVPVKPALKQHSGDDDDDDAVEDSKPKHTTKTKSSHKKKKESRHLKWDEQKIQEHDKLRGTRMKIEEPNTPYHQYDSGSETDGSLSSAKKYNDSNTQISWDALTNKLEAHAAAKDAYPSSPSSYGGNQTDDDKDERQKELKHLEFKEHRKRHYNEMELVRKFRQEHPDGLVADAEDNNNDDDDDDDNDADDENE